MAQNELNLIQDLDGQGGFPLLTTAAMTKQEEPSIEHGLVNPFSLDGSIPDISEGPFGGDYGLLPPQETVIIRPYGDDGDDMMLAELRPRWIIMYDPNQDFLRRVEVY